jgi:nitroreductase
MSKMANFKELVLKNRSYRRFDPSRAITRANLVELVKLARQTPSAANRQPLRYLLSADAKLNAKIFPNLVWAAYMKDWPGPAETERPTGYIVLCVDTDIAKDWWCDDGIAAQTIMLGAVQLGFGGCMIGAIKHNELRETLGLADNLKIRLVLALGAPAEEVQLDPLGEDGSIKYWRDEAGMHHVPKRSLDELIIG